MTHRFKNINNVPQFEIIRCSTNCSVLGLQMSVFDSQLLSKMAAKKRRRRRKKKNKKKTEHPLAKICEDQKTKRWFWLTALHRQTDRQTHTHTQTTRVFSGPKRSQYIQSMKMTECKNVSPAYLRAFKNGSDTP